MTSSARVRTPTLTTPELGLLRHSLRTPINQIVGYAELLLEESDAWPALQTALTETLTIVRGGLAQISTDIPVSAVTVDPSTLVTLCGVLELVRDRILAATATIATDPTLAPQTAQDVARIRSAAVQLPLPLQSFQWRTTGEYASAPLMDEFRGEIGGRPALVGRILVVDDVLENREMFVRRLRFEGHEVVSASGGLEALALAEAQPFDVILLDVMMPDLDGRDVLTRLRRAPLTAETPVVMISALNDVATAVASIERGADDFITKPFDPVLLRARVSACIERVRLRQVEREYLRDVRCITDAAEAVDVRRYVPGSLSVVAGRDDALGRLARVVDTLATEVPQREDRLLAQLRTLKEEVRTARRDGAQTAPSRGSLAPGTVLAERYEIQHVVGAGGMGVVYSAHDRELGETVALKVLTQSARVDDPAMLERFKSEIRLARRITHENVVRSHDFGVTEGKRFVSMEFVEGVTVRELLKARGRLGVATTLAIGVQLARALDAAHRQGVVHRDIKPDNIILNQNGMLKVMDFGIARFAVQASNITISGLAMGTPSYMAPEQLMEEEVDERTDLYASGVVLYECLTGAVPFATAGPFARLAKILTEPAPDPTADCPEMPPAMAALVRALLSKEPAGRPASAARFGELLLALA